MTSWEGNGAGAKGCWECTSGLRPRIEEPGLVRRNEAARAKLRPNRQDAEQPGVLVLDRIEGQRFQSSAVRPEYSWGKKVRSGALRRKVAPLEPPVPVLPPIIRSTVFRCRNRQNWKASSTSTSA